MYRPVNAEVESDEGGPAFTHRAKITNVPPPRWLRVSSETTLRISRESTSGEPAIGSRNAPAELEHEYAERCES